MSSKRTLGNEASVDEQEASRRRGEPGVLAAHEVADEPELEATVELEIQAKVDTNHPDARRETLTLAAEEKLAAREAEIARTRRRFDRRADSDREARTRRAGAQGSVERRAAFQRRAAVVDPWQDPDRSDARESLSREQLGAVNREAKRLAEAFDGWSRAALSRRLARRVADGRDLASAVMHVVEALETAPGMVIPIAAVPEVPRVEVTIAGEIETLWTPSDPAISQVGLIGDETDRIKFTVWEASRQPIVREGERVRFRGAAKNWYQGRCSIALTRRSRIEFPERDHWLTE